MQKQKVIKKIPQKVIQDAVGLAIFTTMRSGLWVSGAGGSGVLVARKEDGTWSPPSGIMLHTAGLGFLLGVDVYDCVVVINSRKTLESFMKIRATLGGEISAVAGPVGVGGVLENDGMWKQLNRPVFTYLKSRGFYAGVQVDGTLIIERTDENERFYHERIGVADILAGNVKEVPPETKMLMEALKMVEGKEDVDKELLEELEGQPAPGDVEVEVIQPVFGIPEPDDPDPFGVHALEEAGFEIREAGNKSRPDSTQFEFRPSPSSPLFSHLNRRSVDTNITSNRGSYMTNSKRGSTLSVVQSISMGTQTDMDDLPGTPLSTPSIKEETAKERDAYEHPKEVDYTKVDLGPYSSLHNGKKAEETSAGESTIVMVDKEETPKKEDIQKAEPKTPEDSDDGSDLGDLDDDEPVVYEAAAATRPRGSFVSPGKVNIVKAVNILPRPAPPLPPRSSARGSRTLSNNSLERFRSPLASPMTEGFQNVDLNRDTSPSRKSQRTIDSPIDEEPQEKESKDNVERNSVITQMPETIGEYVSSAIQTGKPHASSSDKDTSSQSSRWNAASLPQSRRPSVEMETGPTTSPTSPAAETASDDKQLHDSNAVPKEESTTKPRMLEVATSMISTTPTEHIAPSPEVSPESDVPVMSEPAVFAALRASRGADAENKVDVDFATESVSPIELPATAAESKKVDVPTKENDDGAMGDEEKDINSPPHLPQVLQALHADVDDDANTEIYSDAQSTPSAPGAFPNNEEGPEIGMT